MCENDFPLQTDVNKATGETEHEGKLRDRQNTEWCEFCCLLL